MLSPVGTAPDRLKPDRMDHGFQSRAVEPVHSDLVAVILATFSLASHFLPSYAAIPSNPRRHFPTRTHGFTDVAFHTYWFISATTSSYYGGVLLADFLADCLAAGDAPAAPVNLPWHRLGSQRDCNTAIMHP